VAPVRAPSVGVFDFEAPEQIRHDA
jgi:hypothetical protein